MQSRRVLELQLHGAFRIATSTVPLLRVKSELELLCVKLLANSFACIMCLTRDYASSIAKLILSSLVARVLSIDSSASCSRFRTSAIAWSAAWENLRLAVVTLLST